MVEKIKEKEKEKVKEKKKELREEAARRIVVPGEVLVSGPQYLPGDNTIREGADILAMRFGLVEQTDRLIRIIPLSGIYLPRRGNTIIGCIKDITWNGWVVDINSPYLAFLPVAECRQFIKKEDLAGYYNFGDLIVTKVMAFKPRSIDLTMKDRGLFKLSGGTILTISPTKVPRVIGKKGSMVNMIKDETGCSIVVGQNGRVWIKGTIEGELIAKKAIELITKKSFMGGLTEVVRELLLKHKAAIKPEKKEEKEERGK